MARLRLDQLGIDPNGADRLDRDLRDVFAIQDEIATQIASQVLPQLGRREVERLGAVSGERLDTWDLWLRARYELSKGREAAAEAVRLLETAAARDPRVGTSAGGSRGRLDGGGIPSGGGSMTATRSRRLRGPLATRTG